MAEPVNIPAPLEAETDLVSDNDSALGDDGGSLASSTTSINSSILRHRVENGRTYHAYKDGKYLVPNDEGENDRLDLQHHLYSLNYDGKLFICPLEKKKQIHNVLDVGTGTGIWAIDFGDEFPESKVLGVDISPSQPDFVPPNVSFEIDDLEEDWTFSEKFDFIHSRMMTGALSNWRKLFAQAFEFNTPGGYFEITDVTFPVQCDDDTVRPESALRKWSDMILDVSKKMQRDLDAGSSYKDEMEKVGYTDIEVRVDVWPMNRWPKGAKNKEIGAWNLENVMSGLEGFTLAPFTRIYGWTPEEVELFLVDLRKEMRNTNIHAYWNIYTVYGRKPE